MSIKHVSISQLSKPPRAMMTNQIRPIQRIKWAQMMMNMMRIWRTKPMIKRDGRRLHRINNPFTNKIVKIKAKMQDKEPKMRVSSQQFNINWIWLPWSIAWNESIRHAKFNLMISNGKMVLIERAPLLWLIIRMLIPIGHHWSILIKTFFRLLQERIKTLKSRSKRILKHRPKMRPQRPTKTCSSIAPSFWRK